MAEITITETDQRRSTARILDVREDFEVAEGMIPGALHIPMGQLQARLGELDPALPVIAVCRSGNRSAAVADALNGVGYKADTMAGGMPGPAQDFPPPKPRTGATTQPEALNATGLEEVIQAVKNLDMDKLRAEAAQQHA